MYFIRGLSEVVFIKALLYKSFNKIDYFILLKLLNYLSVYNIRRSIVSKKLIIIEDDL